MKLCCLVDVHQYSILIFQVDNLSTLECLYIYIAKNFTFICYGGEQIYHKPGCRKDLENLLLHSDGT